MTPVYYLVFSVSTAESTTTRWAIVEVDEDLDVVEDLVAYIKKRQREDPSFALISWKKLQYRKV